MKQSLRIKTTFQQKIYILLNKRSSVNDVHRYIVGISRRIRPDIRRLISYHNALYVTPLLNLIKDDTDNRKINITSYYLEKPTSASCRKCHKVALF